MGRHRSDGTQPALRLVGGGLGGPDGTPPSPTRKRCALVVDDERQVMVVICRIVESMGWAAAGFRDPRLALASLERNPGAYDIILTDLRLGDGNGLDVAAGAVRLCPAMPVVLLSGAPLPATAWEVAADAGVRMVIYKPFRIHEVMDAVRSLAGGGEDRPPSGANVAVVGSRKQ
ncbi:MAG: response regulator [Gemmatimonadaceae bacterium]|nr:response regulator [Gemmatimonadaceae bacterium]